MFLVNMRLRKTQQICDKAILENGGTLESVPYCCKKQQVFDKVVDYYSYVLKFVPDCYMTQKMCDKIVILQTVHHIGRNRQNLVTYLGYGVPQNYEKPGFQLVNSTFFAKAVV